MRSMTGFAAEEGAAAGARWRWELRSVNGRGLEIRFRTPSGFESRERDWREHASARVARGTLTVSLTLEEPSRSRGPRLDAAAFDAALSLAREARERAAEAGFELAPPSLDALLALRGVVEPEAEIVDAAAESRRAALATAVDEGLDRALDGLVTSREEEGGRLAAILAARLDEISALEAQARSAAAARGARAAEALREKVAALLATDVALDPARLAQELALLAVKADVAEELDRLAAHLSAGRALLSATSPVGRKLDFLTQEFNREANTLCAKAQDQALSEIGLALKVVIDQLREQAANVE